MKFNFSILLSLFSLPLLACNSVGDLPGPGCSSTQTSIKIAFAPPMAEGSGEMAQCLPRAPSVAADGAASSVAFHATQATGSACSCPADQGLQDVSAEHQSAASKFFDSQTGTIAKASCVCEVKQLTASDMPGLTACKQEIKNPVLDSAGKPVNGYCYVDVEDGTSNPEVLANCASSQRRAIRFVGRPATREADDLLVFLVLEEEVCDTALE